MASVFSDLKTQWRLDLAAASLSYDGKPHGYFNLAVKWAALSLTVEDTDPENDDIHKWAELALEKLFQSLRQDVVRAVELEFHGEAGPGGPSLLPHQETPKSYDEHYIEAEAVKAEAFNATMNVLRVEKSDMEEWRRAVEEEIKVYKEYNETIKEYVYAKAHSLIPLVEEAAAGGAAAGGGAAAP